ncbi:DUF2157 domain-containing protein [Sphingobacterium paludis]|uniref:Putative membrane protein DUF2157 n=1 Tax=Sphingobacterium paludis TaxID=1476465 RepID=A0A4R7CYU9_9SPHI|nr:DUF2157 domain-containing protein [Sphingobacterium paludis]TDS12315.1 putative membrane protein DUF2157 [Sphingobacterium paludis]
MNHIKREDIHRLAPHSSLTAADASRALRTFVYPNTKAWQKFLRIFFLILGVGFSILGVIFFFAYNWADLHKFAKIGIIEALVCGITLLAINPKFSTQTKNILLTGSSLLVGALFSIFGQIYQTGANAYDFFLAWTLFVTIWVIIARFAPLSLFYLVLVNSTLILYEQQVTTGWPPSLFYTILFLLNGSVAMAAIFLQQTKRTMNVPIYFTNTVSLAAVAFATRGAIAGIFSNDYIYLSLIGVIIIVLYSTGMLYAIRRKDGFYVAILSFSLVVIVSALWVHLIEDVVLYLFVSAFIIMSVTFIINNLLKFQKAKHHGTEE